MLGKEGRLFVLGYALAAIYEGPVANLKHNLNEVVASLGCTVELQINNTRATWRISTAPLRAVFKDLLGSKESLKAETRNISTAFKDLDAQVSSEAGYEPETAMDSQGTAQGAEARKAPSTKLHLSTQKMFELKTKLRCSYVVNRAILNCHQWFDRKHEQCMQRIWVPLLNHLLCLPMKFKFFCGIAKVMEVWCRSRIPVEGNFGQTYDSLNQSIHGLDGEFSANIDIKEEKQAGVLGLNTTWEHVSTEVRDYVERQEAQLEWVLGLLHALLSCTFLLVLRASFSYMDSYNQDIRFDNIYISTYFCQIDERRKKLGKRTLLPLRKAEKKSLIFPCKPTIQASEMSSLARELLETLPVLLLLLVLCGLDWALYSVFDTIRQHSFLQYSFQSSHKLEVKVEGDSMLARLLRKTIGALNTSSDTGVESNNMRFWLPAPEGHRSLLLSQVLSVPAREEAGPVPLQRAIEEESSLHEAEAGCYREAGPAAEGSTPPPGGHPAPPLPGAAPLAAPALRGVPGPRDDRVPRVPDARLPGRVLPVVLGRHAAAVPGLHASRGALLFRLQRQQRRHHLRGVKGWARFPLCYTLNKAPCSPLPPVLRGDRGWAGRCPRASSAWAGRQRGSQGRVRTPGEGRQGATPKPIGPSSPQPS
ncbi:PREDICTED: DC-STAMP domain-containing protein 1 isoform X3 [Chinchilla lanigera]|nr:PREDICTED: DC-STAMP domain-containing protein 1 isoform X3 [Chinchilla lanigera]